MHEPEVVGMSVRDDDALEPLESSPMSSSSSASDSGRFMPESMSVTGSAVIR